MLRCTDLRERRPLEVAVLRRGKALRHRGVHRRPVVVVDRFQTVRKHHNVLNRGITYRCIWRGQTDSIGK